MDYSEHLEHEHVGAWRIEFERKHCKNESGKHTNSLGVSEVVSLKRLTLRGI
jgi:hypothetical protein